MSSTNASGPSRPAPRPGQPAAPADRTPALAGLKLPGQLPQSARLIVFLLVVCALEAWGSPPWALIAGLVFALCLGNPLPAHSHKLAKYLLQGCVVLLGFGMNLPTVLRAGLNGAAFAALTIGSTLLLGWWLGRVLAVNRNTSTLISAGTAICGGSAIAAVGCVLAVTEAEIAVAIGTVFLLNAVALYLFPLAGHMLHLNAHQFGVWAGVAIHDISSVVGASVGYGQEALQTATAVKLSRTLWIVPLTLAIAFAAGRHQRRNKEAGVQGAAQPPRKSGKLKIELPWFIGLFLLASVVRSCFPAVAEWSPRISAVARGGFTLVLCLIGASLSMRAVRAVGWKAALQGILLWGFISIASLGAILCGYCGG